jgi:uncharacterized protein (TIGR04255 family)
VQATYPVASKKQTTSVDIVGDAAVQKTSFTWVFEDERSQWTVSLAPTFVALETKHYVRFQDFLARFEQVLQATREIYGVQLMERIGLRYVDHISRAGQPRLPENWTELLNSAIIPLRAMRLPGEAQSANLEARFLVDDFILAIRALFLEKGFPGVSVDELVLDFDCYAEKRRPLDGVTALLERFRAETYRAFRWAVGDLIRHFEAKP